MLMSCRSLESRCGALRGPCRTRRRRSMSSGSRSRWVDRQGRRTRPLHQQVEFLPQYVVARRWRKRRSRARAWEEPRPCLITLGRCVSLSLDAWIGTEGRFSLDRRRTTYLCGKAKVWWLSSMVRALCAVAAVSLLTPLRLRSLRGMVEVSKQFRQGRPRPRLVLGDHELALQR